MRLFLFLSFVLLVGICQGQNLMRYSSVLDRNDLEILEDDPKISFDNMGIIMIEGRYDPDLVMEYGLLCYERYKETNNNYYFLKVDEQCQYIFGAKSDQIYGKNSGTAVRLVSDTFDLTAPRYSAFTQGLALSLVLRFATKETAPRILKFQDRLYQALTRPQEFGGMLGRTDEGLVWLEEFPGSGTARNSLKGMLTGLIGLIEYTETKKDNIVAKRLVDDLLNSLVARIGAYNDVGHVYSSTNRSSYAAISDQRDLIFLFKHLYELTADPIFIRQAALITVLMGHKSSEQVRDWDLFYSNMFVVKGRLTNTAITVGEEPSNRLLPQEEFKVKNGKVAKFPWFVYSKTDKLTVKEPSMLTLQSESDTDIIHLYYRYSWNPDLIDTEPWSAKNGRSGSDHKLQLAPGYYQFMTIHENEEREIPLKTNSLKKIEN